MLPFSDWSRITGSRLKHGERSGPVWYNERQMLPKGRAVECADWFAKCFCDESWRLMCYLLEMSSEEKDNTFERRMLAIEDAVRVIRSELTDIREIFSKGYDVLSKANDNRSRSIQIIARHIDQIEERLEPTFNKAFPQHEEFLREAEAVFDKTRKSQP